MTELVERHLRPRCEKALEDMESALEALDQAGGMNQVGAHLDLAICRLRAVLTVSNATSETDQSAARSGVPSAFHH
jgi:hypothetical protein